MIILIYGFSLGTQAKSICKQECEELGTEFYDTIKNGKWNVNDLCVCYLENEIKTFVIQ